MPLDNADRPRPPCRTEPLPFPEEHSKEATSPIGQLFLAQLYEDLQYTPFQTAFELIELSAHETDDGFMFMGLFQDCKPLAAGVTEDQIDRAVVTIGRASGSTEYRLNVGTMKHGPLVSLSVEVCACLLGETLAAAIVKGLRVAMMKHVQDLLMAMADVMDSHEPLDRIIGICRDVLEKAEAKAEASLAADLPSGPNVKGMTPEALAKHMMAATAAQFHAGSTTRN